MGQPHRELKVWRTTGFFWTEGGYEYKIGREI
jgi:hypothetical protein